MKKNKNEIQKTNWSKIYTKMQKDLKKNGKWNKEEVDKYFTVKIII
jgi:hypothetical protein